MGHMREAYYSCRPAGSLGSVYQQAAKQEANYVMQAGCSPMQETSSTKTWSFSKALS